MNPLYNFMNSKVARILRTKAMTSMLATAIITSLAMWDAEAAPTNTPQNFIRAIEHYKTAENQEENGHTADAALNYQATVKLLEAVAKSNPGWQSNIVEFRLRKARENADRLEKVEKQGTPNSTAAQPTPQPVPTPTTPAYKLGDLVGKKLPIKKGLGVTTRNSSEEIYPPGHIVKVLDVNEKNNQVLLSTDDHDPYGIWKEADTLGPEFSDGKVPVRIGTCRDFARMPYVPEIPTGTEADLDSTNPRAEDELLALINQHRTKKGLPTLNKQASLTKSARLQCARLLQYPESHYLNGGVSKKWGGPVDMTAVERLRLYCTNGRGYALARTVSRDNKGRVTMTNLEYRQHQPSEILDSIIYSSCALDPNTKYIGIGNIHHQWWVDFGN